MSTHKHIGSTVRNPGIYLGLLLGLLTLPQQAASAVTTLSPDNSYFFAVTTYNDLGLDSVDFSLAYAAASTPDPVAVAAQDDAVPFSDLVPVSIYVPADLALSRVQLMVNGVGVAESSAAPYAFSWDTSTLTRGDYTIAVKAIDVKGNEAVSEALQVSVAGDTVAPQVSLGVPAATAPLAGNVQLSASASDHVGVSRLELYLDDTLVTSASQGAVSYTWNTLQSTNGSHTLAARAYDLAGNRGEATPVSLSVFNDTIPPSVSFTAPAAGSGLGGTLQVAASASDNVAVARVEFYLDDQLQGTVTAAPYGYSWDTRNVSNGSHTLIARAYDPTGNVASAASSVTVFNDTTPPSVSLAAPAAGSSVSGTFAVTANASDNVGVIRVDFYLNGALQGSAAAAPFSYSWNTKGVADGSYTWSARAYDAAGNQGQSASVAVKVQNDLTPPALTLLAPKATYLAGATQTLSFSATDNIGVVRMELFVDDVLGLSTSTGSISLPWTFSIGLHTVLVKAYDAAGNVKSLSKSVIRYR